MNRRMISETFSKITANLYRVRKANRESLVDEEGQPVYPITWNNDFIDLPLVIKREQRRGKLSAEEIEKLIAHAEAEWVHAVHVLSAATGMRIAEILAIDINTCLSPDCSMILVKQQVKGSRLVQYLKTDAAYRFVDLCPEAVKYLRNFVGDRKGLLFPSRKHTTPLCYGNFLKRYLTPAMTRLGIKEPGKALPRFSSISLVSACEIANRGRPSKVPAWS
jgi:integrase